MKLCVDCSKECKPESLRCIPCANKRHRNLTKKSKEENKKPTKMFDKFCEECKEFYKGYVPKQRFCSESCRKKNEIDSSNSKWVVREERKNDIHLNDRLEYDRVKKKPVSWMKKFKAVRG